MCPNKTSAEWKYLTGKLGELTAMKIFMVKNDLPDMNTCEKLVDSIYRQVTSKGLMSSIDNGIEGFPFSERLQQRVEQGIQKYSVRDRLYKLGLYKINDNIFNVELVRIEPLGISHFENDRSQFIRDLQQNDEIGDESIQDFLKDEIKRLVYKVELLHLSETRENADYYYNLRHQPIVDDDDWGNPNASEYYDDNLDMDQQSLDFWNDL